MLLTYTHYSRNFSAGAVGDDGDVIIRPTVRISVIISTDGAAGVVFRDTAKRSISNQITRRLVLFLLALALANKVIFRIAVYDG